MLHSVVTYTAVSLASQKFTELRIHQHNDLCDELVELWTSTNELVIHRCFDGIFLPFLRLTVLSANRDCVRSEFFLHQRQYLRPQIACRIYTCKPNKLVLKGNSTTTTLIVPTNSGFHSNHPTAKPSSIEVFCPLAVMNAMTLTSSCCATGNPSANGGFTSSNLGTQILRKGPQSGGRGRGMYAFHSCGSSATQTIQLTNSSGLMFVTTVDQCSAVFLKPTEERVVESESDNSSDSQDVTEAQSSIVYKKTMA